jgi:hypothetical protein
MIKFMRGWSRIIARKRNKEMWMPQQHLENICVLLEEDLHNVTL